MAAMALPRTPSRTPKKTERIFFSPSGSFICICCQKVTLTKRRICLWKDGNLSSAGQLIQSIIPVIQQTDFQVICELCLKKFKSHEKKRKELLTKVTNGREESERFVRRKFKRGLKPTSSTTTNNRKKLFKDNDNVNNVNDDAEPLDSTTEECVDVRILV